MELILEREGSLTDLRRTQRRVAALLMTDTHVELQKYSLRRRLLTQGFCYVCSRIDPSGIFRKPNSYLYKKGFFHTCEHFPKAPYTTFVEEEVPTCIIHDDDGGESLDEFATNQTETISVTIRRGSRSTQFASPLKREGTFESNISKFEKDQILSRDSLIRSKVSGYTVGKLSLPPVVQSSEGGLSAGSLVGTSTIAISEVLRAPSGIPSGAPSCTQAALSRNALVQSESMQSGTATDTPGTRGRVTIIPTGFDRNSVISGLSTFTKGPTPSKSTNDLDSKFSSNKASLEKSLTSKQSATTNKQSVTTKNSGSISTLKSSLPIGPIINQADGLQEGYAIQPLVREVVMLDGFRDVPVKRPKARKQRGRLLPRRYIDSSDESISSYRPDSGHLRYHHRMSDDSVPDPGFEIPPTPSDEILEMEKLRLEQEHELDSGSSKGVPVSSISDDASLNFSDNTAKSKLSRLTSEHKSFCRCVTDLREISFSRGMCRTCGKACHTGSITCGDRESSLTQSQTYSRTHSQTHSRTGNDTDASSSKRSVSTRQKMLQRDASRLNIRSKPITDEDYMDLNSIIHEDDGRYWSSDEDFELAQSPLPWLRYKHAHPYPLVNPDIHKLVYIEALQAAKMKSRKELEDLEFNKLRRPNVFSYIPPYPDKTIPPLNIGIRPDDSAMPKKGQFMKHIFGDVRPEDFYPGSSTGNNKLIKDDSSNSSTEQSSSNTTESKPVPVIPEEPDRSSVSMKMRKQGISFDNDV